MKKTLLAAFASASLILSAASFAPMAHAQVACVTAQTYSTSLTNCQVDAIDALLSAFGADQNTRTNVRASLTGGTSVATTNTTSANQSNTGNSNYTNTGNTLLACSLTSDLSVGASDSASSGPVSRLQKFLGMNPSSFGYFGVITKQTLQDWQSAHNVTASGALDTATRARLNALYGCATQPTSTGQSSITVIQPNGGEEWQVGNTYTLRWTSQGANVVNYPVQIGIIDTRYNTESGPRREMIIANSVPNTGSYSWTVPQSIDTMNFGDTFLSVYKIVVHSWSDSVTGVGLSGMSSSPFAFKAQTPSTESTAAPIITNITSRAANANEIYTGEYPTISGTGLGGTITVHIGGHSITTAADKDTSTTFLVPSLAAGKYDITVTNASGKTSNAYTVTVIVPNITALTPDATVYVIAHTGGSIAATPGIKTGAVTVASGGSVTFTVTPSSGFVIDAPLLDGINRSFNAVPSGASTKYTFTNVMGYHTFEVTFKSGSTSSVAPTVSSNGVSTVTDGTTVNFTWYPKGGKNCYWSANGVRGYDLAMPTSPASDPYAIIPVSTTGLAPNSSNTYAVTATCTQPNGLTLTSSPSIVTVTPAGSVAPTVSIIPAASGVVPTSVNFTWSPNGGKNCYWSANGVKGYDLAMPVSPQTSANVSVPTTSLAPNGTNTYVVTATCTQPNGTTLSSSPVSVTVSSGTQTTTSFTPPTVSSNGVSTVTDGTTVNFTWAPGTGTNCYWSANGVKGYDLVQPTGTSANIAVSTTGLAQNGNATTYAVTASCVQSNGSTLTSSPSTVTVTPVASVPPTVSSGGVSSVTEGATVNFTWYPKGGKSCYWSANGVKGYDLAIPTSPASDPYAIIPVSTTGLQGTYAVTATCTQSNGSILTSSPSAVTVNPVSYTAPTLLINGTTAVTVPLGTSVTYSWSRYQGTGCYWSVTQSGATVSSGTVSDSQSTLVASTAGTPAGTYAITVSCAQPTNGAIMTSSPVSLTVSPVSYLGGTSQTASVINALFGKQSSGTTAATFGYHFDHDLQIGSSYFADVSALQIALLKENVYSGEVTGGFYAQTFASVKAFQQKYGIETTGFVGSATRAKLNELYGK